MWASGFFFVISNAWSPGAKSVIYKTRGIKDVLLPYLCDIRGFGPGYRFWCNEFRESTLSYAFADGSILKDYDKAIIKKREDGEDINVRCVPMSIESQTLKKNL